MDAFSIRPVAIQMLWLGSLMKKKGEDSGLTVCRLRFVVWVVAFDLEYECLHLDVTWQC